MTVHGDGSDDLLFLFGWGNRPAHAPETWLLDGLTERGWTVHAVTLPENGTAFGRDYVDPVAAIRARVDPDVTAGHSLGGLTLAHLPGDGPRLCAAPFWGLTEPIATLAPVLTRLPTDARLLPAGTDPAALGEHKPTDEPTAGDRGASPAWLAAVCGAQRRLPRFREGSVVYCSLADEVVSPSAIGERVPADRVRLYDGGHEFFASRGREKTLDRVANDLRTIADGDHPPPTTELDAEPDPSA